MIVTVLLTLNILCYSDETSHFIDRRALTLKIKSLDFLAFSRVFSMNFRFFWLNLLGIKLFLEDTGRRFLEVPLLAILYYAIRKGPACSGSDNSPLSMRIFDELNIYVCLPFITAYFPAMMNCMIHTVMYTYYLLAALGDSVRPYLWWKKYLTRIQLVSK